MCIQKQRDWCAWTRGHVRVNREDDFVGHSEDSGFDSEREIRSPYKFFT